MFKRDRKTSRDGNIASGDLHELTSPAEFLSFVAMNLRVGGEDQRRSGGMSPGKENRRGKGVEL